KPFETLVRDDPKLRLGARVVAQRGMRGFKLQRVRKLYRGGEVEREESWELNYPATREIVRVGSNPNGELPPTQELPRLREPAASMKMMRGDFVVFSGAATKSLSCVSAGGANKCEKCTSGRTRSSSRSTTARSSSCSSDYRSSGASCSRSGS